LKSYYLFHTLHIFNIPQLLFVTTLLLLLLYDNFVIQLRQIIPENVPGLEYVNIPTNTTTTTTTTTTTNNNNNNNNNKIIPTESI
jgi:hypothetical protein